VIIGWDSVLSGKVRNFLSTPLVHNLVFYSTGRTLSIKTYLSKYENKIIITAAYKICAYIPVGHSEDIIQTCCTKKAEPGIKQKADPN